MNLTFLMQISAVPRKTGIPVQIISKVTIISM